ncbi:glycosyltransferase family 4 protein [Nostoc sp. MS1]|uniref:glycosyltransferase family 4 protein n=1 Tax=Nostoc sp. MS1 TaxID=2764711 RepID=UPI001CC4CC81|nr:glycosyltransferase family 1 protein [Nostoc sp. MS1]BCL35880.1 hypothetical protein NSMS1_23270 [Nostoc sp. MS1]
MLKITIDATPIMPEQSGVGFHVLNLINSLYYLQSSEQFQLFIAYQPRLINWLKNNRYVPLLLEQYTNTTVIPLPVRLSNLLVNLSPQLFSFYLEKYLDTPDIVHGTNHSVYPYLSSRRVLNIYDLAFEKYPQYVDSVAKNYKRQIQQNLQWTDLILTSSESSKKDIIEYLQVDPKIVYVTPLASRYHSDYLCNVEFSALQNQINYNFDKPYLLFVSTIEPRKNITNLITAFNLLKQKQAIEHNLVLIGKKGWSYKPIFTAIENSLWKNDIHHLDYLSDELVALFYAKANVFVYPSYYEGFGLPVLEAMTLGAPVVTSNTSSIPEVAGDAALLIDPNDPIQLADAILKVISDSQLRQDLIIKGKERAKLFSWERTAKETLNAYKSLF